MTASGDDIVTNYGALMRLSVGAAALASLARLGVVEALCQAPSTSGELAAGLQLDEPALVRALRVAEAMGVLARDGDQWRVAPALIDAGEQGPGGVAQVVALLQLLPEHLRTGATLSRTGDDLTERYRVSTPGLSRLFAAWARELAARIDRPLAAILDVGAGAGVWSLEMARRQPGCRVTALDRGPVLAGFVDAANEAQVQHATLDGDYHQIDIAHRYDRVVLANVVHLESPDAARALVRRAGGWLRPGGDLVVIDMMVRNQQTALDVAVYELHLALRVAGGRVYLADAIESWCRDAGLVSCALHTFDDATGGAAMVAERPA